VTKPAGRPIGLTLARTAKIVGRAFDDALAAAGGSTPIWLILISLKTRPTSNQRELAGAVGIQGATLTHHLNAMESSGLITRRRDPDNRRVHIVEMTDEGADVFLRLREVAISFDRTLLAGIDSEELAVFIRVLQRMQANVVNPAIDLA
jgi:MarR family transcriptional regulator for hemolysin